jgi:hypothetical protein
VPAHVGTGVPPPGAAKARDEVAGRRGRSRVLASPGMSPTATAIIDHAQLNKPSMARSSHHAKPTGDSRGTVSGALTGTGPVPNSAAYARGRAGLQASCDPA